MDKINSENIDIIREDLNMCFRKIEEQRGITIKLGNTSYDNDHFTTKLTVLVGDGSKHEQEIWNVNARFLGIPNDWFGREFINKDGKVCKITGINPKAYKMPIKYEEVLSGKRFKTAIKNLRSIMSMSVNSPVDG